MTKIPIDPSKLYKDSFELADKVYESQYEPDLIVGIWRGGTPPAITISEYLIYKGIDLFHTTMKSEAYTDIDEVGKVRLDAVQHLIDKINKNNYERMLIVDDINDTGKTLKRIQEEIVKNTNNTPEIRIAVLYERSDKEHKIGSDYVQEYVQNWIVFPHELEGLTKKEVGKLKPWMSNNTK